MASELDNYAPSMAERFAMGRAAVNPDVIPYVELMERQRLMRIKLEERDYERVKEREDFEENRRRWDLAHQLNERTANREDQQLGLGVRAADREDQRFAFDQWAKQRELIPEAQLEYEFKKGLTSNPLEVARLEDDTIGLPDLHADERMNLLLSGTGSMEEIMPYIESLATDHSRPVIGEDGKEVTQMDDIRPQLIRQAMQSRGLEVPEKLEQQVQEKLSPLSSDVPQGQVSEYSNVNDAYVDVPLHEGGSKTATVYMKTVPGTDIVALSESGIRLTAGVPPTGSWQAGYKTEDWTKLLNRSAGADYANADNRFLFASPAIRRARWRDTQIVGNTRVRSGLQDSPTPDDNYKQFVEQNTNIPILRQAVTQLYHLIDQHGAHPILAGADKGEFKTIAGNILNSWRTLNAAGAMDQGTIDVFTGILGVDLDSGVFEKARASGSSLAEWFRKWDPGYDRLEDGGVNDLKQKLAAFLYDNESKSNLASKNLLEGEDRDTYEAYYKFQPFGSAADSNDMKHLMNVLITARRRSHDSERNQPLDSETGEIPRGSPFSAPLGGQPIQQSEPGLGIEAMRPAPEQAEEQKVMEQDLATQRVQQDVNNALHSMGPMVEEMRQTVEGHPEMHAVWKQEITEALNELSDTSSPEQIHYEVRKALMDFRERTGQ